MKRPSYFRIFSLLVFVLALPACETMDNFVGSLDQINAPPREERTVNTLIAGNCPQVKIVDELATLNEFTDIANPKDGNLISSVNMTQVDSSCKPSGSSVSVDLKLAFEGRLGPQGRRQNNDKPFSSYPFFVAVTAPNGDIMAKEVFAASITYDRDEDAHTYYESLRQIIPVGRASNATKYKVLVGFQLSEDQLAYNRSLMAPAVEPAASAAPAPLPKPAVAP